MLKFELTVFLIGYRLTPLVRAVLARNLDGEMAEPTVRSRSVPVLNLGRNVDAVARLHLDSFLALLLIVAASSTQTRICLPPLFA